MDSNLKSNLKRHFKNYEILMVDLDVLHSKYRNLAGSLYTSPNGVYLTLTGTIPFMFSGFTYKAPVMIKVPPDYPFSAPSFFVVPSESVKLVKNHPNVESGGSVTLNYLDKWTHTSKLVDAVDAMHKSFNRISPIYSASLESACLKPKQAKPLEEITDQAKPEGLFAKYRLTDRDRNLVEHAYQNILTDLKNNRENIIRQYMYDLNKYEVHRKVLMNWAFALLNLNTLKLKLDEIEENVATELKTEELEKAEKLYDEIGGYVESLTNAKQFLSSLKDDEFELDTVIKFKDQDSQKLSELIATEASCLDMLEFLHETHKKGRISTRTYVKEMRRLSYDQFIAKLGREKLLN